MIIFNKCWFWMFESSFVMVSAYEFCLDDVDD